MNRAHTDPHGPKPPPGPPDRPEGAPQPPYRARIRPAAAPIQPLRPPPYTAEDGAVPPRIPGPLRAAGVPNGPIGPTEPPAAPHRPPRRPGPRRTEQPFGTFSERALFPPLGRRGGAPAPSGGFPRAKAVVQGMIYREDTRDHPQYPPISLSASNRRSSFFFNLSSSKSPGSRENHTEAEKPGLPASSHLVIGPTLLKTWRSLWTGAPWGPGRGCGRFGGPNWTVGYPRSA